MPNPRNYPGTSVKRSPFDTVRTASRGFKRFTSSFEAFANPSSAPIGHTIAQSISQVHQAFVQSLEPLPSEDDEFNEDESLSQIIEIVLPSSGTEARLRVLGITPTPLQDDPFGVIKQLKKMVIGEVKEVVTQMLMDDERKAAELKLQPYSKPTELAAFAKRGSHLK